MMETPPNRRSRPTRLPTPKLSERKKSLFSPQRRSPIREDIETNIMDGLMPLDFETALLVQNCLKTSLRPKVKKFSEAIVSILKDYDRVPLSILSYRDMPSKTRTSPRNAAKRAACNNLNNAMQRSTKEQACSSPKMYDRLLKTPSPKISSTDELGTLFKDTLHLKSAKHSLLDRSIESSSDEVISEDEIPMSIEPSNMNKRTSEKSPTIPNDSPKKKYPKLDTNSPASNSQTDPNSNTQSPSKNKNFIGSIENFSIPAKSFYSSQNKTPTPPKTIASYRRVTLPSTNKSKKKRPKPNNDIRLGSNVSHKIRRPKFKPTPQTIETILQSLSSEKFKALRLNRLYQKKAEEVHKLMRTNRNPIEMSRPLNIHGENDSNLDISFSDSEEECEVNGNVAAPPTSETTLTKANPSNEDKLNSKPKKFFKSSTGTGNRNAFTITNNLRATIQNGRVSILPSTSGRRKLAGSIKSKPDFTTEHAAVKDIIDWLDDDTPISNPPLPANIEVETSESLHEVDEEFADFRKRLPYKTSDPAVIEQQKQLLDFLISYEICTERNFEIFIIDPENHKKEASDIVDSLITVVPTTNKSTTERDDDILSELSDSVVFNLTDSQEANHFRQRLPYNTVDPVIAEQQKTLLEFLIKNQICTEENFQIFIADPENHRDRASKILQNYMIGSKDDRNEATILQKIQAENCMSIDPFSLAAEIPSLNVVDSAFESSHSSFVSMMSDDDIGDDDIDDDDNLQWNRELSPTIPLQLAANEEDIIENAENKSNNPDEGNFYPIFNRAKFRPIIQKSTRKKSSNAMLLGGFGANQYQIDAGQKAFGAKQCSKCGLVYTVHEPEEEKLHAIFHRSITILKFKGWIDEDIVSSVPEWGSGGRILRITNNINSKRLERVIDILNIVDKELGIVSDMIPTPFVSYFAVKSNEIVGFCLVQPLKAASRYVTVNGIDCCTEETFNVRCGISRIWVSPLNRGSKIATKLFEAVRLHTIMGTELSTNEIAFSSPTEDGKLFAQKITKRKDFLVYQSF